MESGALYQEVYRQTRQVVEELQQTAKLDAKQILVVGASSSEVLGKKIGTSGSEEVAKAIVQALFDARNSYGFQLAFQCCEHLNRALVCERRTMEEYSLEEVTVIPVPKAGGAVSAQAYRTFQTPVAVEAIRGHAGIDIGDTLIGMHLKAVAVPVRVSVKTIGAAHVVTAVTRPKLIGGARAVYNLE
ncbi:TIGR01440 family protein [Fodinisporobacter ferrooxydans]|uniref:UPF0340 protein LSG31_04920 n=1 Tax=Fodinisporobacter ferrooxydans TaxID=2901836 RepID=A0ABY4CS11_9BACL|nr:TIGR01440 family protein [Alicyclobacillaceae bacterium MYW30-H2]